jgi:tRNA(fMet)-specific endonuclease VapC
MPYLLDTNTCIAAMRGNQNVILRLQRSSPADCAISTITSFELLTGVHKCREPLSEEAKVKLLLGAVAVLDFGDDAALKAAMIRCKLESGGRTIGPYDLLLAGQAVAANLILVTNNIREFSRIDELVLEDWTSAGS